MTQQLTQNKAQQQRSDLTGEHAVGDAGQIVLACLFAATWIADTFFFKYMTFLNQYVLLGIRIPLGVVLLILSGYLAGTGLPILFGEQREKPGVMKTFIDRLFFYYHPQTKDKIAGKSAIIITPMNQQNVVYESETLVHFYNRLLNCLGINLIDMFFFGDIMKKGDLSRKPRFLRKLSI